MSWFNRKKESAMSKLSKKICEKSFLCAESLRPDLENKFGKDSKEFNSKYRPALFEFVYFFIHLTDRYAFEQFGLERRDKLLDELTPTTIEATIQAVFGHCPKDIKDEIERDVYSNLHNATMDYGKCKELLLDPKDDTRAHETLESGAKSKSMVGQLTDNLSQIIEGTINTDLFFPILIWGVVIESLKKKELQALVSEVYR